MVEPKTAHSRRVIALPARVVAALREHRRRQVEERLRAGEAWQDTGLVFTTQIGTPIDPRGLIRRWHQVRSAAGLSTLRFHDLRHGCATLLLAQGKHPKLVQELLGHHSITMTSDLYSHVTPAMRRDLADAMDALLDGAPTTRERVEGAEDATG